MIKPPPLVLLVMEVHACALPSDLGSSADVPFRVIFILLPCKFYSGCCAHAGCESARVLAKQMACAPQAVCVLRGEKPDWDTAKKVLGEPNFMRSLLEFDKDNIPDSIIRKLRRYVVRYKAVMHVIFVALWSSNLCSQRLTLQATCACPCWRDMQHLLAIVL